MTSAKEMLEKLGYRRQERKDEFIAYFNDKNDLVGDRIVFWLDKEKNLIKGIDISIFRKKQKTGKLNSMIKV